MRPIQVTYQPISEYKKTRYPIDIKNAGTFRVTGVAELDTVKKMRVIKMARLQNAYFKSFSTFE